MTNEVGEPCVCTLNEVGELCVCTPTAFLSEPRVREALGAYPGELAIPKSVSLVVEASPTNPARVGHERMLLSRQFTQGSSQSLATLGSGKNAFGVQEKPNRSMSARMLLALLALLLPFSYSRAEEPAELSPREKGNLAIQARSILNKYCSECHNGKSGSRGTITVLDHSKLLATGSNPIPFVLPKKAEASQIIQFIEDGTMPPGNRARPSADETAILKKWIAASAPSYPISFDEQSTLKAMLDDLESQPPNVIPHLRYFSLAHLVGEGGALNSLGAAELQLRAALNWCNPGMVPAPVPVDGTATLYRFDIHQMGWDGRELFFSAPKGAAAGLSNLTPYDLILLEYPHGFRLPDDHPQSSRLNEYLKKAKQIQPVPFLRADWLAAKIGKDKPLAADLKSLNELQQSLKSQGFPPLRQEAKVPCGLKPRAFIDREQLTAAARPESLPVLPLGSWYLGDCRTEPAPFAVKVEAITADSKPVKSLTKGTPFRLRVTTDHDIHFVLLMVWADGSVVVQATNKGSFLSSGSSMLMPVDKDNKAQGAFQITDILTGETKAMEYFVLLASSTELPTTTIVKSRHASTQTCEEELRFPISRFFFDPEAKKDFDPSRVVRVVVPLEVTAK
jgi:hypothetical protein